MSGASDLIDGVRAYLLTVPGVINFADDRIYGGKLPDPAVPVGTEIDPTVVLRYSGGIPQAGTLPVRTHRLDGFSYGPTEREAKRLSGAVRQAMYDLRRSEHAGVTLLHARPEIGAIGAIDPELEWPFHVSSWRVAAYEERAA